MSFDCKKIAGIAIFFILLSFPVLAAGGDTSVLVLQSEDVLAFRQPVEGFKESLASRPEIKVEVKNIRGSLDRATSLLKNYREDPPEVIYALGAQAAYVAKKTVPEVLDKKIPYVFSSVLDWKEYGFKTPYSAGIKAQVPVRAVLVQSRMVLPALNKLGVLYSSDSRKRIDRAREIAKDMGITINKSEVEASGKVGAALESLSPENIDALWLPADPVVVTAENFRQIRDWAWEKNVPLIVYSESFVRAGGLISVSINYNTVGSQAASLVLDILGGKPIAEVEVVEPIGTEFLGNSAVARKLQVDLKSSSQFMDRLIEEVEGLE